VSRFQHPTNTRTIRVLCTGQVDSTYILKAFKNGADGVLVIGCRIGECHYISGNLHARWKVDMTKKMLEKAGMSPERIDMRFISSAEVNKYIEAVKEFTNKVKSLGPSPVKSEEIGDEIKRIIDALISTASGYRIRSIVAKKQRIVEEGNVYSEKVPKEEIERVIEDTVNAEFIRESIISCLKKNPQSCTEIADNIDVLPEDVLSHLIYLRRKNIIDVDKVEKRVPLYKVL
jgi:coenzyme F420-reducing hydrogenase delta subunit